MIDICATDGWIQRRVTTELRSDVRLRGAAVEVVVDDGFVTLIGFVFDWHQRMAAQDAAKRVAGVQEVANEIYVELHRAG